jgi:hypothetical protein
VESKQKTRYELNKKTINEKVFFNCTLSIEKSAYMGFTLRTLLPVSSPLERFPSAGSFGSTEMEGDKPLHM